MPESEKAFTRGVPSSGGLGWGGFTTSGFSTSSSAAGNGFIDWGTAVGAGILLGTDIGSTDVTGCVTAVAEL